MKRTLEDIVAEYRERYTESPEEIEAFWRRFVAAHPEADIIVLRRRSFDEMHDQVVGNLLLAKPSANGRPTIYDRAVAWWRKLWSRA